MNSCNECGRSQCDCEEMMLDVYDTEIVPGEEYLENQFDEAIHKDNAVRYLIEDGSHKLKTR
ncbi:MAG: hypothetical protein ABTA23_08055 [Solibacillus sp.]|uniref:YqaI family protein n=1 Tax=Solibacillus sp. TaxID=1909654 RepID=UPI0033157DC4